MLEQDIKKTLGDKLVYLGFGVSTGLVGKVLFSVEKVANHFNKSVQLAHDYAGPLLWLSHYVIGNGSERTIPRGSPYYLDWVEGLNAELAVAAEIEDFLRKRRSGSVGEESKLEDIALELLSSGFVYSVGEERFGLFHMIGSATVQLSDAESSSDDNLYSEDHYIFEKIPKVSYFPEKTAWLVSFFQKVSPMFRKYCDGNSIDDEYFAVMGVDHLKLSYAVM